MIINVVDLETCGLEPPGVVEIAVVRVPQPASGFLHGFSLVNPGVPISYEAMATHHITEEMVADQEPFDRVLSNMALHHVDQYAAHNAEFDSKFFPEEFRVKPWICTWRSAMHLWPDAPSHSNQVLRYWLELDVSDMPESAGATPHRALYDAWCTAKLLERMFQELEANGFTDRQSCQEELIRLSGAPVLLRKVRFGKHRDRLWSDVPRDYLSWILKQTDMNNDVLFTARHYLKVSL